MIKKQAAEIVMGIFVLLMFVLMFASPYGAIIAAAGFGLFILFGLFGSRPFAMAFSDNPTLIEPAVSYCSIVCIGSLFAR